MLPRYLALGVCLLLAGASLVAASVSSHSTASAMETVKFQPGFINKVVKRNIDIRSHSEEATTELTVENTGNQPLSAYFFAVHPDKVEHISIFTASVEKKEIKSQRVLVEGATGAPKDTVFYRVTFREPVAPGASVSFTAFQVFTHTLIPFPEEITQEESQYVKYHDNHFLFSAYETKEVTTVVRLASDRVESRSTNEKPSKQRRDNLDYGPYNDVKPFSVSPLHVHYENNTPFVTFTKFTKNIEVSHWGNVAVEERYYLRHTGARLKGSFSRHDYQRARGQSAKSSFRTISAVLPKYTNSVYYRDQIGNISTSHLRVAYDHQLLEVDPRFPMFGGWQCDFQIGYLLPVNRVVSVDKANGLTHVLNVTFSTSFTQAVTDKAVVRVVLPEGASDIKYIMPFAIDEDGFDKRFTYLDTVGRPVLVLKSKNLNRLHNQYFQVIYTFNQTNMLVEPLMLSAMFFGLMVIAMISVRVDLSLTRGKAAANKSDSSSASSGSDARVSDLTKALEAAVQKFLKSLDENEAAINAASTDVEKQLGELKKADVKFSEAAEKIRLAMINAKNASKAAAKVKPAEEATAKAKVAERVHALQNSLSLLKAD